MARNAIVTGGGTGIGREVGRRLAADGMDVVITGRRRAVLEAAAAELGLRAVAFELGGLGITANIVAPGMIEDTEFFGAGITEERRALLVSQAANGRTGSPSDVAGLVAHLASPEAGHIAAQVLHVNGGAFRGR